MASLVSLVRAASNSSCFLNARFAGAAYCCLQTRGDKHYLSKWRWHRGKKVMKVELPDFQEAEKAKSMTPEEIRQKMKEKGILPARPWIERPLSISCTGATMDKYVPPEGDGKLSAITPGGVTQTVTKFGKKSKSYMSIRKIKTYDEDFTEADFAATAWDIYQKAHECLAEQKLDDLHEFVTEKAYDDMTWNVKRKTIRWSFLKSLEPPRVVQARIVEMLSKENLYAQVTVRFHTQQTLAAYDRFGRLEFGSSVVAKDVLEYVVFEKHLVNEYGIWRIHEKLEPEWLKEKKRAEGTGIERTLRKPREVEEAEEAERQAWLKKVHTPPESAVQAQKMMNPD